MKQNRIAYLCSGYPTVSHTFIIREVEELRKNGLEILTAAINTFNTWPQITEQEKEESQKTFYVKAIPKWKIIFYYHLVTLICAPSKYIKALITCLQLVLFDGPKSFVKAGGYFVEGVILAHWLQKHSIHHLHVHFLNPASTVALIVVGLYRCELSFSVHGPDEFYNVEANLLSQKINLAKFIRCISYFCRSQMLRLAENKSRSKFRIIRCGVNTEIFTPNPPPENEIPEILCVGRLTKNKGQATLLQACAKLSQKGKDFHLNLVGDGEDRSLLENMVVELGLQDQVTFAGSVGQMEIKKYYQKANAFVLPSFAEGIPIVLMEAMAMGVPVISTHITGIPELITEGENGYLVFASDVIALAQKLENILAEPALDKAFRDKARQTIEDKYDIKKNYRQLAEIFQE